MSSCFSGKTAGSNTHLGVGVILIQETHIKNFSEALRVLPALSNKEPRGQWETRLAWNEVLLPGEERVKRSSPAGMAPAERQPVNQGSGSDPVRAQAGVELDPPWGRAGGDQRFSLIADVCFSLPL